LPWRKHSKGLSRQEKDIFSSAIFFGKQASFL
jgi:hypothetical protein